MGERRSELRTRSARFRPGHLTPLILLVAAMTVIIPAGPAVAADPPLAITDPATSVSGQSVHLNGRVNPKGAAVAVCRFEYGTDADYGAIAPCTPSSLGTGTFNVPVSAEINALEPGVTYHYRLVATSVNGAASGVDRTVSTEGDPICPNFDRRLEQGILAIQLPDCMAFEQVNPPKKLSQRAGAPTISADGDRVAFKSLAALADTPGNLAPLFGDVYVASRSTTGWTTAATSTGGGSPCGSCAGCATGGGLRASRTCGRRSRPM